MKALLRERLGLAAAPDAPLIGFVGRLTRQKGVDVVMAAVPALLVGSQAAAPCRWHAEPATKDEGDSPCQPAPAQYIPDVDRQSMQLVLLGTGEVSVALFCSNQPMCIESAWK
jgi:glycosyltransferase involved in cell wall biosynthesis